MPLHLARYLAALLGGGANDHGRVLTPETMATVFAPQYQPDPRISGNGLAFFRANLGGHLAVEHDGILPGFDAQIFLAPDNGIGVVAFATGATHALHWMTPGASTGADKDSGNGRGGGARRDHNHVTMARENITTASRARQMPKSDNIEAFGGCPACDMLPTKQE